MIDLFFIPNVDCFTRTVTVDVVVRCDEPTRIVVADVAFTWNPKHLTLVDCHDDRADVLSTLVGFPPASWDFYGANETIPPADGNGWISWLSPLNGIPVYAEDTILMSLVFTYDDDCPKTSVGILECLDVDYPLETVIYGTDVPGVDVTGTLNGCTVRPCFVQFAEEA